MVGVEQASIRRGYLNGALIDGHGKNWGKGIPETANEKALRGNEFGILNSDKASWAREI